ncbi:hypothetical protein CVV26_01875 [Candidatus Kuenenbacteria bacterium HGW-Kuenenbacteria-1]|uniref:NYN domain-containing protein n=1 Tax=Candidatus Kuenenbacteria bacterium HGW-Kuenenbacteria-1 TaxID=2013812 RepID=A0A2N1UNJ3_9BACT|nr:MAG: hypothetical protein CVV26_01875 [Candidatus Kuenenbacteria bacterium HGW-Kuenenbacteria-1]
MVKHKEQRVGIFIDVSNMYHSAKNLYQARVNFGKILEIAVAERKLIRAIAYVIKSQAVEEQGFFDALQKQGFELKIKNLQIFFGGEKKGNWDIGIAIDSIKLANRLDTIILITGDGDFCPLIAYLKENKGCQVEVMAFSETASAKLIEIADDFTDLSKNKSKILIRSRKESFHSLQPIIRH